jgi:hypothetical protein
MTFLHFVRRAHLYMGLFLLPWVVMFGVSSIPLNHNSAPEQALWVPVGEHRFDADVPPAGANLRPLGRQMMQAAGVDGGYFVNRVNPRQVNVHHPDFLGPVRITYDAEQKRLIAERRQLTFRSFISGLHTRGGYDLDGFWDSVWAVFVDVVSVALILWIASGVFMWWHLPSTRRWGWTALAAGAVCFAVIIVSL